MTTGNRENPIVERIFYPKDSLIIRQGDRGDKAYLILSGRVDVFTEQNGQSVTLATLETGEIFGETALFSNEQRTASVKATENCNLIALTRATMIDKMRGTDPTIQAIFKMLMARVTAGNQAVTSQGMTIGSLVPIVNEMFAKAVESLSAEEKETFRRDVQPILQKFIRAVEGFN